MLWRVRMHEELEYTGTWWFPAEPEEELPGTLILTPHERATLNLIGSFKGMAEASEDLEQPEIILGKANGKDITLYKCYEAGSNFYDSTSATSSFSADMVFAGVHFQKPEDIRFKWLAVHYLYLDEWVNISGFDISRPDRHEVVIKYRRPEPIHATVGGDKVSISIQPTFPVHYIVQKEACIKQKTQIVVEPSEEKTFDEYLNVIRRIQNFLSLGIMEPVYPLAIQGETEIEPSYPPVVEIHQRPLPYTPKAPRRLYPFDMLFTFESISNKFEVFLRNWFEKAYLLEPVYNLYFGTIHNPYMYLEHEFLSLIRAIETFHRRIYDGKYLPDGDYNKVYDALVNTITDYIKDKDLKTSLKSRLEYGNEFSLRKRLKDIFSKYQKLLNRFIENKMAFIHKVVETRNYLTHYHKDRKEDAVSVDDLLYLTEKLKILVEICLLTELGFSLEEVNNLFSQNYRYRHEFIQ